MSDLRSQLRRLELILGVRRGPGDSATANNHAQARRQLRRMMTNPEAIELAGQIGEAFADAGVELDSGEALLDWLRTHRPDLLPNLERLTELVTGDGGPSE